MTTTDQIAEQINETVGDDGVTVHVSRGRSTQDQTELEGMPARPKMPSYHGVSFNAPKLAFNGGVEITITNDTDAALVKAFRLGQDFELVVSGTVTAHKPTWKLDKDGNPAPVLVITLTVDSIDLPGE